jgi:hypothetical protein
VTTTLPVVAPAGTGATMLVFDQLVGVAVVPLNFTVLVPCVAPKFVPVIVTDVATGPLVGDRVVILGATVTVKLTPLLARPPTVTTTLPVVAPAGTGVTMLVFDQLVGVAVVPLNFTVLVPCVAPKFVPVIVTDAATGPVVGDSVVMLGATVKANARPLLAVPPTVTTTLPLVLDQLVGNPGMPLNVTVFEPWVAPKFVPVIVIGMPTGPLAGDKLVNVGAEAGGMVTGTSAELALVNPLVLYACTTKKYVCPAVSVTTVLVTLPTSMVVV